MQKRIILIVIIIVVLAIIFSVTKYLIFQEYKAGILDKKTTEKIAKEFEETWEHSLKWDINDTFDVYWIEYIHNRNQSCSMSKNISYCDSMLRQLNFTYDNYRFLYEEMHSEDQKVNQNIQYFRETRNISYLGNLLSSNQYVSFLTIDYIVTVSCTTKSSDAPVRELSQVRLNYSVLRKAFEKSPDVVQEKINKMTIADMGIQETDLPDWVFDHSDILISNPYTKAFERYLDRCDYYYQDSSNWCKYELLDLCNNALNTWVNN